MPLRVNIVGGGARDAVDYPDDSNTKAVKEDLHSGFDRGILKRDGNLVLSDILAPGVYEYHLTAQQGQIYIVCFVLNSFHLISFFISILSTYTLSCGFYFQTTDSGV
jgi:hypothetical protein